MKLSIILQNQLQDILSKKEINKSPSTIRSLLEDKIDFAKQNTIDFNIKFPEGDLIIAKENLTIVSKLQDVYNAFMQEYEQYLDTTKELINN